MDKKKPYQIGQVFLILLNITSIFLLFGYGYVAASTLPDNFLKVGYEPSGVQTLYYAFVTPLFALISLFIYLIKKVMTKDAKILALAPVIAALCLHIFLEFINFLIGFPKANHLLSHGTWLLILIFSHLFCAALFSEIRKLILVRKSS